MAQITNRGYILKTQNQYYAEQVQLYRDIDVMWNLDPSTPDGLKIAHDAEVFGALDEQLLRAYLSKDPASATGVDLDIISALTDTYRDSGSRSTVTLKLTGVPGTIIDRGKRVSSKTTGQRWVLSQGCVLDENGEAFVEAYSERVGMIEADAHTLTQIIDAVGGWTGVTNPNIATPGRNVESDAELRIKRLQQVAKLGESQVDSMKGEIYDVKDVRRVEIYENDTGEVDDIGLPAHSTCVLVDGGAIDEIATAIYMKRNPGTLQFLAPGCEHHTVDVTSPRYPLSRAQPIKFNRPKYIDVEMVVEVVNDGSLPSNANDLIEQAILEFTNGELIPDDVGFKRAGFDIGENVPISTMMTPVNKIIGQYGNSYIKSLTLNGVSTGVLEISPFELTRWVSSNIEVIVK